MSINQIEEDTQNRTGSESNSYKRKKTFTDLNIGVQMDELLLAGNRETALD